MYTTNNVLMQYHEQRVEELSREYRDAKRQEAQILHGIQALTSQVRSWFDRGVETVSGSDSRYEPKPVRVENS